MAPHGTKTATTSSQKHVWTCEDRTLLAVIKKFYSASDVETASIFNHLIYERLLKEGITDGLAATTISAQVYDLKRTSRGQDFQKIQFMSLDQARKEYHPYKDKVELAAQSLKISLRLRLHTPEPQKTSPSKRGALASRDEWSSSSDSDSDMTGGKEAIKNDFSRNKRRKSEFAPLNRLASAKATTRPRARREPTEDTIFTSASFETMTTDSCSRGSYNPDSEDEDDDRLGEENDFSSTATRMDFRLKINFNNKGRPRHIRPRLLFRAFDPKHKLRARRFLSATIPIPLPPGSQSDDFERLASKHLHEDKTFASPFLSLTDSIARALDIIAKAQYPLSLAIFDYNDLEEDVESRYGKENGLWLVPKFCEDHLLKGFTRIHNAGKSNGSRNNQKPYTGSGEVSRRNL